MQFQHPNRRKWKQQTVLKIRKVMATWKTNEALSNAFNSALTNWMDEGQVDNSEYPGEHQEALHSQWQIGWKHIFTGHISQA